MKAGVVNSLVRRRVSAAWPPGVWPSIVLLAAVGLSGPNWDLAVLAVAVLMLGVRLLWRPGEPPILLFIICYQWLQAAVAIFHANVLGLELDQFSQFEADMRSATLLSLVACLALAMGMRWGAGPYRVGSLDKWKAWVRSISLRRWFQLYLMVAAAAFWLQSVAWVVPGLRQILLALAGLKWAFFWMLAYAAYVRGVLQNLTSILLLGLNFCSVLVVIFRVLKQYSSLPFWQWFLRASGFRHDRKWEYFLLYLSY